MSAHKILALALLVACTPEPVEAPDAGSDDIARNAHAYRDAAVEDAPACFTVKYYQCGAEILQICVPYGGCGYFRCRGDKLGYCYFGAE